MFLFYHDNSQLYIHDVIKRNGSILYTGVGEGHLLQKVYLTPPLSVKNNTFYLPYSLFKSPIHFLNAPTLRHLSRFDSCLVA